MNSTETSQNDIFKRFQVKLDELKTSLPLLGKKSGNSCAANILTNILNVLNMKEFENFYFNNLAIPFSGFGTYRTKAGWKGPCGIVSGAIASIGIIMGGQEKTKPEDVPIIFMKALRFADKFESEFGSLSCMDLCGYDLSKDYQEYVKNKIWEQKCCKYLLFAVEQIIKLTKNDLKTKWS